MLKITIKKIKEDQKKQWECKFCTLVYEKSLQINNKIQIVLQENSQKAKIGSQ